MTPLDLAIINDQLEMADLLMGFGALSYGALVQVAAAKIQAAYRGYTTRKWLAELLTNDCCVTRF